MNHIKSRIFENVGRWTEQRHQLQPREQQLQTTERFDREVQRMEDAFLRVSALDGTQSDLDAEPGRILTENSKRIVDKTFRETERGFVLAETELLTSNAPQGHDSYRIGFHQPAEVLPRTTKYEGFRDEGIVVVSTELRNAFGAQSTSFVLDLEQGVVRDQT